MNSVLNQNKKLSKHEKDYKMSILMILIFFLGIIGPYIMYHQSGTTIRIEEVIPLVDPKIPALAIEEIIPTIDTKIPSNLLAKLENTGFDFSDAVEISMSASTGNVLFSGSVLGELNSSHDYVFYKYSLNDSGPVDIKLSSTTNVDQFQFFIDVFIEEFGIPVGSAFDGNPLIFNYFTPIPGSHFNYIFISGFDTNFEDSFDIFFGDSVAFNISISQIKKGVAPVGATSQVFNSIAFEQVEDIFDYFVDNNFIDPGNPIDLSRGDPFTGLDSDDEHFFKAIALSIYGIVRAGDFVASANNNEGPEKSAALYPFIDIAYELFNLANDSLNVLADNSSTYNLYGNPNPGNRVTLTDNAYMLLAIGEIVWKAGADPQIAIDNGTILSELTDWAFNLANSIINEFICASCGTGLYVEELTDFGSGGGDDQGNLVELESMAILAEAFSELNLLIGYNATASLPSELEFPASGAADIRTGIVDKLLITDDTNTTIDLFTGADIGIGVEWWDKSLDTKSNISTLMGNLAYALHRTSQFDIFQASDITTNILRLFSSPTTGLLYEKALIIEDGTILDRRISTLDNVVFILLAQRLENKWKEGPSNNNNDISRSWGRKAIANFESLLDLLYDEVDQAVFGMYDDQAMKLVSNDNAPESNRFVANAFLNSILVRIFPVQMGTIADNNVIVDETADLSLELSQIPISDSLNWWDFIITFNFQLTISIPAFSFEETETIDLADFADFAGGPVNSKFIPFSYEPTQKGNFTIAITLSVEGRPLLVKTLELTALGILRAEVSNAAETAFATDDASFTTEFTLIDNTGTAIPNLNVNASLGKPHGQATLSTYIKTGRSDASGKVAVKFDTSDLIEDGIINQTEILALPKIPDFVFITLYINVTNANSLNLEQAESLLKIRLQVRFARMSARTSPTLLEITQGTTEAFTFIVTALDQDSDPISNALVSYNLPEITGSANTVFTNADGEATITLRDNDLFGLSNIAIRAQGATETNISMTITHEDYPTRILVKSISIAANNLSISITQSTISTKAASIFEPTKPSIDIDVVAQDLFGKQVAAEIRLVWFDNLNDPGKAERLNAIVPLDIIGITPHTFTIDPSNLFEGEHTLLLIARKDGITTTKIITTGNNTANDALAKISSTDQFEFIDFPVETLRKIIIEPNTIEDIVISIFGILSGLIIAYAFTRIKERGLVVASYNKVCPHCEEYIYRSQKVCPNCGRDVIEKSSTVDPPTGGGGENNAKFDTDIPLESDIKPDDEDQWPDDDPFKVGPAESKDDSDT